MLQTYLRSRNRWTALGFLLVISCAAAGRSPQEVEKLDRTTWPREIDAPSGRLTIYEPQLESLQGARLVTRAAVSMVPDGASEPVFGAIWLETTLAIDADRRTARADRIRIAEIRFPNADASALRETAAEVIARWNPVYSMDTLHAELKLLEERKAAAQALKADVSEILFRSHPAVLLTIDGEPEWRPIAGSRCRRIANSAFFIVEEPNAGSCFLHLHPFWWTAASERGPWQAADDVPGEVAELWKNEPKPQLPPDDGGAGARRPEVIVTTRPAELIWTDGLPQYAPIAGTNLLYVKNTTSDVFLEISTQMSYVLLSGRWYRTESAKVAWEFVASDQLPVDFSRIPLSSEKHHVLACVAGTPQARDAVRNSEIPQTEAVKPGPAPDLTAAYDGEPRFEEIQDSTVRYAVNSPYPIFHVERRYYWCNEGIWYDSDYSLGPWFVCTYVPRPIYRIPPSCPYYYVTYCHVYSVTPRAVYVGYTPGYRGCYVWGRTVVYGTGWNYRWWTGNVCYSRPATWGACVRYSPSACTWTYRPTRVGYASSWVGPTLAVGVGGRVGVYRNNPAVAVAPTPVRPDRPDNLYRRQPDRIAPTPPTADHRGLPRKQPQPRETPPVARPETPKPPVAPDTRELPRRQPQPPPRETPPPLERRAGGWKAPPPPPPAERREPPRQPPPVERREPPRQPPPPQERREWKAPPPPPPPQERREWKAPPPRREPPRQPDRRR